MSIFFAKNTEIQDGRFLAACARATIAFIYARLFLGLFGMDTYEIYWWFAAGITMSLWRASEVNSNVSIAENTKKELEMREYFKSYKVH